jgi:hypothetical protein
MVVLAGWLAGWLACWLAGWLAGCFTWNQHLRNSFLRTSPDSTDACGQ